MSPQPCCWKDSANFSAWRVFPRKASWHCRDTGLAHEYQDRRRARRGRGFWPGPAKGWDCRFPRSCRLLSPPCKSRTARWQSARPGIPAQASPGWFPCATGPESRSESQNQVPGKFQAQKWRPRHLIGVFPGRPWDFRNLPILWDKGRKKPWAGPSWNRARARPPACWPG